jgi:nucleotide-binding universal stress UspA family protein
MKILLAVDGSEYSDAAAESLARRPLPAGSEVKIISVMEPFQPYMAEVWALPAEFWDDMDKSANAQADMAIEKSLAYFQTPAHNDVRVTTEAIKGNPKHAIVDEATNWGADLIVIGSHGYTGLRRVLLGSVSQSVAQHATCSVEIVRKPVPPDHDE